MLHGAAWSYHSTAGIVFRYLNDTPAGDNASVASSTVEFLNYTDAHDVDEDKTTISSQGGAWNYGPIIGIALRYMNDSPTTSGYHVASSTVEFLNYTDGHDVDEDIASIMAQGGYWDNGASVGVTLRLVFDLSSAAYDTVASRRNITQHDS